MGRSTVLRLPLQLVVLGPRNKLASRQRGEHNDNPIDPKKRINIIF
jgi:hypothetical protein